MDRLWAPWRTRYIMKVGSLKGCIFCSRPRAKRDKENFIVERTPHSFSILNIYPYNNGHMMIAPNRHVRDLSKLSDKELLDLMRLVNRTQALLEKVMKPDGFNIGVNIGRAAGAGVKGHVHIHIVPRWSGDANFLPIFSSTKVMSQSLDALYSLLIRCSRAKR